MKTDDDSRHRILVVDDEKAILFALKEYFKLLGYTVDGAREVDEAQALLSSTSYPVAIVDLRLTGRSDADGIEFVGYLRERFPQTRVIVLTAFGSSQMEEKAYQIGVDAFLHKPKPMAEVAQIVFGLVEGDS